MVVPSDVPQHTIILLQPSKSLASRTFADFETLLGAMEGKSITLISIAPGFTVYLVLFFVFVFRE
jgi:hypothetical protein